MSHTFHNPQSHAWHAVRDSPLWQAGHEMPVLGWVILAAVLAMLLFAIAFSPSADVVFPYVTT
jgi:hypothetical protein